MNTLQAILQPAALTSQLFPVTSRYHGIGTAILDREEKTIIYLRRRFVPPPERFSLLHEHSVADGERLDNIVAQYFSDPEQFWQLCDANRAMHPDELTQTVGRRLRVTLPEDIPGMQNA